eukprot:SAG31_NODE_18881_length_619_cov_1.176923_1_plen_87_part_10
MFALLDDGSDREDEHSMASAAHHRQESQLSVKQVSEPRRDKTSKTVPSTSSQPRQPWLSPSAFRPRIIHASACPILCHLPEAVLTAL